MMDERVKLFSERSVRVKALDDGDNYIKRSIYQRYRREFLRCKTKNDILEVYDDLIERLRDRLRTLRSLK
jgi:hypothetical protein